MSWGGLNPALTAWRTAVMARFPDKDTASDGARADNLHGSTSQHQPDGDSTVDAYDMDVNLLTSGIPSGSHAERALVEAMKTDFERDPRARGQLWIHNREIANRDVENWRERAYAGANPHDKHVHWQSRQDRERDGSAWPMPHTDALLRDMREADQMGIDEFFASVGRAVRGEASADAADRANRNNFAAAMRFAAGLNYDDQRPENMVPGQLGRILAIVEREDQPEG